MAKRRLSKGEQLVADVLAAMQRVGVEPDEKEAALLETAREIVDAIDRLSLVLRAEGDLVTSSRGDVRPHPASVERRQYMALLPRVLSQVVIGDSSVTLNATKQRAANTRWARRDQQREAAAGGADFYRTGGRRGTS